MNCYVKKMVTKYIKPVKMIVHRKGKKRDNAARTKPPNVKQILDISYTKIIDYIKVIIEMKWTKKSIRIGENP